MPPDEFLPDASAAEPTHPGSSGESAVRERWFRMLVANSSDLIAVLDAQGRVLYANPTAEQLAKHWYFRLKPVVEARSGGLAQLAEMVVWETPNCRATFSEP